MLFRGRALNAGPIRIHRQLTNHDYHFAFLKLSTNALVPHFISFAKGEYIKFRKKIQIVDQKRLLSSQFDTVDSDTIDESSTISSFPISTYSGASRITSLDMVRLQKPSERFVSNRSDQEWVQIHTKIMNSNAKDKVLHRMDIIDAEQCIRWWISQCRNDLQKHKLDRRRNNRFKSMTYKHSQSAERQSEQHCNHAAKAIVSAFDLFGRIALEIEARPELLHIDTLNNTTMIDEQIKYWYDGRVPKATHLLNAILDAWRICWISIDRNNKHLPTPQSIFSILKDNWSDLVPMNERTYSLVMDAPVSSMNLLGDVQPKYEIPVFCEEVINFMLQRKLPKEVPGYPRQFASEISTLPDNVAYATALNAWARSGHPDAASRAEDLFNQFSTLCSNGTLGTMPNSFCYNTVLVAMTTPSRSHLKYRAILLKRNNTKPEQKPNQEQINSVLDRVNTMIRAEDVFRTMQLCPYPNVWADTVSFRTIIFAWAEYSVDLRYIDRKKSSEAFDHAKGLLYEMAKLHVETGSEAIEIDFSFFGKLISTLVLNQPRDIDEDTKADLRIAEEIYQYMLTLYRTTRDDRFTPDPTLLCAMILLYAKDGRPFEADAILRRLEDEARLRNQVSILPRMSYYNDTLRSFMTIATDEIKSGKHHNAAKFANKGESIILRMIDIAVATNDVKSIPNRISIQNMLELWISCRMPQRAEKFFRTIEKSYEANQCRELRWSPYYFRRLLIAWATECNDSSIYAAQAAENILNEQRSRYEKSHDVGYKVSAVSISLVISAWLKTDSDNLVSKCKSLFDDAVSAYNNGNLDARPDVTLYGTVFKSFSRVGDAKGAMKFLETMLTDYFTNGNSKAKPSIGIFNMVLLSCLRSNDYKAPIRALEVLESMQSLEEQKNLGLKADYRTFSILSEIFEGSKVEGPQYEGKYEYFLEQRDRLAKEQGDKD